MTIEKQEPRSRLQIKGTCKNPFDIGRCVDFADVNKKPDECLVTSHRWHAECHAIAALERVPRWRWRLSLGMRQPFKFSTRFGTHRMRCLTGVARLQFLQRKDLLRLLRVLGSYGTGGIVLQTWLMKISEENANDVPVRIPTLPSF